mmetsp:Transcript_39926/g.101181  ORF Transcript_39926/g.101181 Transcript_39926/m.101181 type:complete len:159 (-) Transcript_39926:11-487(-)|eukprot:jgi/Tetstr1/420705/TSEL_011789.t1
MSDDAGRDARCFVEVVGEGLEVDKYRRLVEDDGAGAIASFVGVTRNTFQGKRVLKLEYEAYVPMAEKELRKICAQMMERWELIKVAVGHRIGTCPVREPSVVITASSPHRAASLDAVHWAIDELKATVPIWKKEFFEGGEVWKENAESRRLYMLHGSS